MRKKPIGTLVIAVLILVGIGDVSSAAVKSGSSCSILGKKVISEGKSYTCVKSGKKLVWSKGVVVKSKVLPSPAATPTASASPSITAQQSVPKITMIPELETNFKYIKYWAWTKAWEELNSNPENKSSIEVLVGPNSKACFQEETLSAIRMIQKVYADSQLPKKLWLLYADMQVDRVWIENKTLSLLPRNRIQYNQNNQMDAIETSNPAGEAVLWVKDSCFARSAKTISSETLHGYTHTIQDLQYSNFPDGYGRWGEVPRWLIEGAAVWSQIFYDLNSNQTKFEKSGDWRVLLQYDQKFFNDYLVIPKYTNNLWEYTDQWPSMRAYDLGAFICDMLVALRGPSSLIELNKDYLSTGSFEKSFKNIYGMTWAEAQPYFSETVFKLVNWLAA